MLLGDFVKYLSKTDDERKRILDKFDDIFETNFYAPVELMRLLYKRKQINKDGSIVILASLGGTEVFSGGNCIYGASKAALNSIMKFCAKEFAQRRKHLDSTN